VLSFYLPFLAYCIESQNSKPTARPKIINNTTAKPKITDKPKYGAKPLPMKKLRSISKLSDKAKHRRRAKPLLFPFFVFIHSPFI